MAEEQFLAAVGDIQRRAKVFVPGRDNGQSLADTEAAIAVCRRERDLALYEENDNSYFERLERLVRKCEGLDLFPIFAGYEWKDLGETYGQAWESLDTQQRQTLLLDSKIKVYVGRGQGNEFYGKIYVPEEIEEFLGASGHS